MCNPQTLCSKGKNKGLEHEQTWSIRSSRVRVVHSEHLTTTYMSEVTSPAVLQMAGIVWPLPCLPWAVSQIRSNHFHQQFKVTYPTLHEGEEGIVTSYISQAETFWWCPLAKACHSSCRAPKICKVTALCLEQRRYPTAAPPSCLPEGSVETLGSFCSSVSLWRRWSLSSEKHLAILLREERSHVLQIHCRKL